MRKRRTRAHIIEDLGFNFLERQVLLAGFVLQRIEFDYGYDGFVQTFNQKGEIEQNLILIQLKSSENPKKNKEETLIKFDLDIRDLELWLSGREVMILVIYDSNKNEAFFVEMRDYFLCNRTLVSSKKSNPVFSDLGKNEFGQIKVGKEAFLSQSNRMNMVYSVFTSKFCQ